MTSATAAQVLGASRRCQTQLDSSKVSGSSTMKIGCTSAIGPVASAPAWNSEATMTMAMPASQTFRRARSRSSEKPPSCLVALVCDAARRCSTDAVALLAAVSNASTTEITAYFLPPGFQTLSAAQGGAGKGRSPAFGKMIMCLMP